MVTLRKCLSALLVLVLLSSIVAFQPTTVAATVESPMLLWKTNFNYPEDAERVMCFVANKVLADGILYATWSTNINPLIPIPNVIMPRVYSWNDVYAFNATTGAVIWNHKTVFQSFGSLAVDNGLVFLSISDSGSNYYAAALNASNGASVWNSTVSLMRCVGTPVICDGVVCFGVYSGLEGGVYAFDEADGKEIWYYPANGGVERSPVFADGVIYFNSRLGDSVFALRATDGKLIWNYTTGPDEIGASSTRPVVDNGVLYFGSHDRNIYALNAATGVKLWNFTAGSLVTPTVVNSVVYVRNFSNVYALNGANGALLWRSQASPVPSINPLTVNNGVVYISSEEALNAYDGKTLWQSGNVGSGAPLVSDGVMYCFGGEYLQVYAYAVPSIPAPPAKPPTLTAAFDNGTAVDLAISGNITTSQVYDVKILTQSNSSMTLLFSITGESGNAGFCNITIPKSIVPYGTTPSIQIDNKFAPQQGYTQDADNFYVWYTTHFSTHQVSIKFSTQDTFSLTVIVLVVILALALLLTLAMVRRRTAKNAHALPS